MPSSRYLLQKPPCSDNPRVKPTDVARVERTRVRSPPYTFALFMQSISFLRCENRQDVGRKKGLFNEVRAGHDPIRETKKKGCAGVEMS